MLIDDFQRSDYVSSLGTRWRAVTDQVMGGVSQVSMDYHEIDGHRGLGLTGDVRLENNGGFVQMALDLSAAQACFDASRFAGLELLVHGNGEQYALHLRTLDTLRPWQSYRSHFIATSCWQRLRLPFGDFHPHRITTALNLRRLRRLGMVAIGRAFHANVTVGELGFY